MKVTPVQLRHSANDCEVEPDWNRPSHLHEAVRPRSTFSGLDVVLPAGCAMAKVHLHACEGTVGKRGFEQAPIALVRARYDSGLQLRALRDNAHIVDLVITSI
jgi:hypothetical protein